MHPERSSASTAAAVADYHQLPLASESIDAVLLHHVLDYSQSPHQLLREASRVIIPKGHLIVVGFNPWSIWGIWSYTMRFITPKPLWRHQYLRLGRLMDWLKLLDMEPIAVHQSFYRPPLQKPQAMKCLQWLEHWGKRLQLSWGGYYLVVARKDHLAMTPLKPAWADYQAIGGLSVTRIIGRVWPLRRSPFGLPTVLSFEERNSCENG